MFSQASFAFGNTFDRWLRPRVNDGCDRRKPASVQELAESATDGAHGLARSMLIFDERKPDERIPVLAESNSRRYRNLCFCEKELGELHGPHLLAALGNLGPNKHRAFGLLDVPADAGKAVNQNIPAAAIGLADDLDRILGPIECVNRGDLDGLEHAVVQIALDARQSI